MLPKVLAFSKKSAKNYWKLLFIEQMETVRLLGTIFSYGWTCICCPGEFVQQQAGVRSTESEQTTVCVQGNEETPCAAVWLIDVLHSFWTTMELYGREKRAT